MADVNNGDAFEDVTQGERKRRQKKVLPKPLLRLLVVLAAVIVVVVVIVVAVTSARQTGEAADYQRYMTSVADLLKQSDSIGGELTKLLTNPGDTSRKDIQTKLDQFVAKSRQLETQAKEMEVPKDLLEQNVHQFLVLAMTFRATGLADLEPSLMNALEVQDTEVAAEQIVDDRSPALVGNAGDVDLGLEVQHQHLALLRREAREQRESRRQVFGREGLVSLGALLGLLPRRIQLGLQPPQGH